MKHILPLLLITLASLAHAAERPNILFIAIDDLRTDLGTYGHEMVQSPNIDRLAAQGVQFNKAYTQFALCAPSRASIMTGLRPDTVGVWGKNSFDNANMKRRMIELRTLPNHLRANGYNTLTVGKIYHGHTDAPNDWTEKKWAGAPDYADPELREELIEKKRKADAIKDEIPWWRYRQLTRGPAAESFEYDELEHTDGQKYLAAVELMEKYADKDKPFFLAVGFVRPHLPFTAPEKYWDLYDRDAIEVPSRDAPKNVSPYALIDFFELRPYSDIPKKGPVWDKKSKELIHGYYASVSLVDDLVGRLLSHLNRLNLDDNTVVVLWSDHGYKLGEYGLWSKLTAMELDAKVPMIVAGPGIPEGVQTDAIVELIDLFPTVSDIAGVSVPETLEGTSFVPVLQQPDIDWKKGAITQFDRNDGKNFKQLGTYLATDHYRYGEWRDPETKELLAQELYLHDQSLVADEDLSSNPKYKATLDAHAELLSGGWQGLLPE